MASTSPSAFSTYIRRGRERIEQICRCVTHIRLMWISRGVPKNFSRIAHGFCWSLAQVQGQGCFTQAAKCSKCRLKYSTHGFDQTDLMSFKLVYTHWLSTYYLMMWMAACQVKSGKNQRLFARPLDNWVNKLKILWFWKWDRALYSIKNKWE